MTDKKAASRRAAPRRESPFRLTTFILGAARPAQFPADAGWEVALAGRSNAGKSSALNVIAGLRGLARISKTPGRTREINFFRVDEQRRLVDLPGYGYAKVPTPMKEAWQRLMEAYLGGRRSLRGLIVVMDSRHPLTDYDRHMVAWCVERGIAVHILLTKADKLSRGAASATLHSVRATVLREYGVEGRVSVQLFSALKRSGEEEARDLFSHWLEIKKKAPVKKREEGPGPKRPGLGKPG